MPEPDHVQLMRECTAAWTEAQQPVRRFIRSLVRDHQHVEDLTQEVAVTIVDKFGEYDRSRSFTAAFTRGFCRLEIGSLNGLPLPPRTSGRRRRWGAAGRPRMG